LVAGRATAAIPRDPMSDAKPQFRSVDPQSLPKRFESAAAEARWDETWQTSGVYHYDPSRPRSETFVVDTPPPTASGSLHPGHAFSYSHADILVRQRRMRGMNIFYPMGWDDNGLPTERRVQNYYHIRCDPGAPYEPGLQLEAASSKQKKGRPRHVSRANFIELCQGLIAEDEAEFARLWRRVGLSVDWRQTYQTIDDHCRRLAQLSFRDLWEKGAVYTSDAPTMWDVDHQTAIAQAEVTERTEASAYHDLEFGVEGSGRSFVVSTTRPELLPACVGVTAHPEDERYRELFGERALTPLFRVPVPIFPSAHADPEKGTGILMVCTFGDAMDVQWWREESLALRQMVGRNGRLSALTFGSEGYESGDPEAANRFYAEIAGKNVVGARRRIVELLAEPEGSATGQGPPLRGEPRRIEHAVKYYEKGERPLEFVPTRQWFVRLLDKKEALLRKGEQVQWHPAHMQKRFSDWTENLNGDWCVSRQRYFGVPIPVWYPLDAQGEPRYEDAIVAEADQLPVDPAADTAPGYEETQRDQPGGFVGEADIFDTWFTSSLSPQISSRWLLDPARHPTLFPADVRPQAHDIVRTWAFYTIAKALMHEDQVPWHHATISGFVLDPERKKMSKSLGNAETPLPLIEQFGADSLRYWAGCARLGVDTKMDEQVFKVGKRLVTKIFNAGKFVLAQSAEIHPISCELDRAFAAELRALVERATSSFDRFDHAAALHDAEGFFWARFTDTFLELAKARARGDLGDAPAQGSAVATLRLGLSVLLRLLAPTLPYVTEEVWSWAFAEDTDCASIHRSPWPGPADFEGVEAPADPESFETGVAALAAINKAKADAAVGMGREVLELTLAASAPTLERLKPVLGDVLAAARCQQHRLEQAEIEDGSFEVRGATFAERS
jgi:valyl-tRNA synthetase